MAAGAGLAELSGPRRAAYPVSWTLRLPYPARNLLRRWRGMVGMMAGVGIALAVVMSLLAMSKASTAVYTSDYLKSGADLYVVTQGGTLIPMLPSDTPGTIKHARHTLAQIRGIAGVHAALGVMSWSLEREREGPRRRDEPTELIAAMGVDGDPADIPNVLTLQQGRWLRRTNEVVVGSKLSREKSIKVGDSLRLGDRDLVVVGIGKLRGLGYSADSIAYLDYRAFRQRAEIGDVVNVVAVDADQPAAVRERIQELGSLAVYDPPQLVRQAEDAHASALVLYWVFNILSLLVGALFVSNMLGRAVAERRLEFGTLRAIGIPNRTILLAVASEALLVSLVACVVGVVLSLLLGTWINGYVAPAYGLEFLYVADAGTFILVFALALGLGLVAGLLPARQATQVDPVVVLREA
jgi:ABC-type lipoprotein release transport system permease subunit